MSGTPSSTSAVASAGASAEDTIIRPLPPRSWVEQAYPNLIYFNEVDEGNHFAAWQEPELFTSEVPRRIQVTAKRERRSA